MLSPLTHGSHEPIGEYHGRFSSTWCLGSHCCLIIKNELSFFALGKLEQTNQNPIHRSAAFHSIHLFLVSLAWCLLPYLGQSVDQMNNRFLLF